MFATGGSFRALLRQPAVVAKRGPRRRVGWLAVVAALAVLSTAMVSSSAAAQAADGSDVVRIVARRLESGRVEFGLQQRQADESWGERRLPPCAVLSHDRDRRLLAQQFAVEPAGRRGADRGAQARERPRRVRFAAAPGR